MTNKDQDAFKVVTGGDLGFEMPASFVSVTELLKKYPALPVRAVLALFVISLMERSVTPFRLCECGCGAAVHGKARLDSPACRQRVSRQRRAMAATGPKQFGLVFQHELPVPIPTVPVPQPAPAFQGSGFLTVPAHRVTPFRDGETILVTGFNHAARRRDGSEPYEVVLNYNTAKQKVRTFKNCADAEAKLGIKIDWSEFSGKQTALL